MNYNNSGWIEELLEKLDRKEVEVTFDPHIIEVKTAWPRKGR